MTEFGSFRLTSVQNLPHVDVAFPGEHWSDRKAIEVITPGDAIMPVNSGGILGMRIATSGESGHPQLAIAVKTVQIPDVNTGPTALGPNQIMNADIAVGEYVHAYYSGAFNLTLVTPHAYVPSDLIGWDPAASRPTGISGTGAWKKVTNVALAVFEVLEFRPVNDANEGILGVRSLRGQF